MEEITSERCWTAALAHAAMIVPAAGLAIALAVWVTQKDKSAYVAQHARQAVAWQLLYAVLVSVAFVAMMLLLMAAIVVFSSAAPGTPRFDPIPIAFRFWVVGVALLPLFSIGALVGAVRACRGRPFFYPFIGRAVQARFGPKETPGTGAPGRDEEAAEADAD